MRFPGQMSYLVQCGQTATILLLMSRTSRSSSLSAEESGEQRAPPSHSRAKLLGGGGARLCAGRKLGSSDDEGDVEDGREEWCRMVETRPVLTL